jgi:hypothetical protein
MKGNIMIKGTSGQHNKENGLILETLEGQKKRTYRRVDRRTEKFNQPHRPSI